MLTILPDTSKICISDITAYKVFLFKRKLLTGKLYSQFGAFKSAKVTKNKIPLVRIPSFMCLWRHESENQDFIFY